MTTCAEYQTRLDEVDAALHALLTGGQVAEVQAGEKRMRYTAANLAALQRYQAQLQRLVDACNGTTRGRALGTIPVDNNSC